MSTPTTSRTCGARASANAPAPVPMSRTRSSPFGASRLTRRSSVSAARASCSAATSSAVSANRLWTASDSYLSGFVPAIQMMTRVNWPSALTSKKLQLCMSFFVPSFSSPM
jgi:hypothetical protein